MRSGSACATEDRLKLLLEDALSAEEQAGLADHLEDCETCRNAFHVLAAETDWWDRAKQLAQADTIPEVLLQPARSTIRGIDEESRWGPGEETPLDFLSPSTDPKLLGTFGAYGVTQVIGRGGMGLVLKGHDATLNRFVAIKVLAPGLAGRATGRRRFLREAQAAAAVTHDHVVTIHGFGEINQLPYLVMEYVPGISLEQRLEQSGPLALEETLRIGMQIASGLAAAHAQGLIHRDIKPGNILLEDGLDRVKITDFGLARAIDDTGLTQKGVLAGTPEYMAPEQATGGAMDRRTDLFSLGSVLYAMCTGCSPFRAPSTAAVIHRVCERAPTPLRQLAPNVPLWLAEIIDRLHAKKPADRFQSAEQVAELLGKHLARVQDPSLPPIRHSWVKRQRLVPARLGALLHAHRRWLAAAIVFTLIGFGIATLIGTGLSGSGLGGLAVSQQGERYQATVAIPSADHFRLLSTGAAHDETVALEPTRTIRAGGPERTNALAVSPDGRWLAAGGAKGIVSLWRNAGDQPGAELRGHGGPVTAVTFWPDGRRLASASVDGTARIWDVESGAALATLKGHEAGLSRLAISPNECFLVTASLDKTVRLWDPESGKQQHQWPGVDMALSVDGKTLAIATTTDTATLWNLQERQKRQSIHIPNAQIVHMQFAPAGDTIAIAHRPAALNQQLAKRPQANRGTGLARQLAQAVQTLMGAGEQETPSRMNNDDLLRCLATTVELYDIQSGQVRRQMARTNDYAMALAFAPDGKTLVAGGTHGGLWLWDTGSGAVRQSQQSRMGGVSALVFLPGNHELLAASFDGTLREWSTKTPILSPMARLPDAPGSQTVAAFAPDGNTLLTAGNIDQLQLWDMRQGSLSANLKAPAPVTRAVYSPKGDMFVTGHIDGSITFWDAQGGTTPRTVRKHTQSIAALAFTVDGNTLCTADADASVLLWDVASRTTRANLAGHAGSVLALAFSLDGKQLATGTGNRDHRGSATVRLWDVQTGKAVGALPPLGSPVTGLAYLDEGTLLSASTDETLVFWDLQQQKPRRVWPAPGPVRLMVPSPDRKTLALRLAGGPISLWSVAERRQQFCLRSYRNQPHSLQFAPDGKTLLSVGPEGTMLWPTSRAAAAVPLAWSQSSAAQGQKVVSKNLPAHFSATFSQGGPDSRFFDWGSANAAKWSAATAEGICMQLPTGITSDTLYGFGTSFGLAGDFEITARFANLNIEHPTDGTSARIMLRLQIADDQDRSAALSRAMTRDGEQLVKSTQGMTPAGGRRRYVGVALPCDATSGSLRIVRTGSTMHYLVASGEGGEYQLVDSREFVSTPIKSAALNTATGGSPTALRVCWTGLEVRAESLPQLDRTPTKASPSSTVAEPTASEAENFDPDKLAAHYHCDFRDTNYDFANLRLLGKGAAKLVQADKTGLRVSMPASPTKMPILGVAPMWDIRGDFRIEASFEVLKARFAPKTNGAGIELSLKQPEAEGNDRLSLGHRLREEGKLFVSFHSWDIEGKRKGRARKMPTKSDSGTLRITRTGTTVVCSFADAENNDRSLPAEFRELYRNETFGDGDIKPLELRIVPSVPQGPVEVCWKQISIDADELPGLATSSGGGAERLWLVLGTLLGIALLAGGLWWRAAAKRSASEAGAPPRQRVPLAGQRLRRKPSRRQQPTPRKPPGEGDGS